MNNKKSKFGVGYLIIRSIVQYIKTARAWAILEHGISMLSAFTLFLGILTTQRLFDLITEASYENISYKQVGFSLGIMAIVIIAQQIFRGIDKYLLGHVSYKNVGKFMAELMQKLSRVEPENFENPAFLDNIDKAKRCIEYEALGYFSSNCLRVFTYYGVFFLCVFLYFFRLSPTFPLIIIISFIPAILGQFIQIKIFKVLEDEIAPLRRQYNYYKEAISDQRYFKETRTLGAFLNFRKLFRDTHALLTNKSWKVEYKVTGIRISLGLISFIGFGVSALMLFNTTISGNITIGTFVAVFGVLSQIFSMADELTSIYVSEGSETLGKIEIYYNLLDMKEVDGNDGTVDLSKGIIAENISFSYNGTNKMAIDNVSLRISEGESIAIVGENGAGKTTLVRLLIGLYRPSSGKVLIGGLDTKKTHPNSIYKVISGVFQNFQRYKMTLLTNVSISNINQIQNSDKIRKVLKDCDFDETMPLDTMLSTEFDGIDLSGGQWQRLAISRGLYRTHELIVLDEPTAAIDPIEEERIYQKFRDLSQNKTTILVTHRLASAKFADKIVVMDKGKILDIGKHDELIKNNGKYASMWKAQSSWYIR